MSVRKNPAFIGAYVSFDLKRKLQQEAKIQHRTLSQELTRILEEHLSAPPKSKPQLLTNKTRKKQTTAV